MGDVALLLRSQYIVLSVPRPAPSPLPPFSDRKRAGCRDSAMDIALGIPNYIVHKEGIP